MTAHLTLPYQWTNCSDHHTCPEHIHLEDTAENLNNYPIEWVEQLLGNCSINKKEIQNFEKRQKHEKGAEAALTTILKATYYLWVPVFAYFMTPSTASNNEYIKYLEQVGENVEDDDRKTFKVRYRETLKEMIQKKSAA